MAEGKTRWGYSPDQWAAAKEQGRAELISRARARTTISYSDLCRAITAAHFRHYSWSLMALLNEICSEEDARHGVMLASLVVRADERIPGRGYFVHAERLGRDVSDPRAYWEVEVERVYQAFSSGA